MYMYVIFIYLSDICTVIVGHLHPLVSGYVFDIGGY